jgi:hypothetical protein
MRTYNRKTGKWDLPVPVVKREPLSEGDTEPPSMPCSVPSVTAAEKPETSGKDKAGQENEEKTTPSDEGKASGEKQGEPPAENKDQGQTTPSEEAKASEEKQDDSSAENKDRGGTTPPEEAKALEAKQDEPSAENKEGETKPSEEAKASEEKEDEPSAENKEGGTKPSEEAQISGGKQGEPSAEKKEEKAQPSEEAKAVHLRAVLASLPTSLLFLGALERQGPHSLLYFGRVWCPGQDGSPSAASLSLRLCVGPARSEARNDQVPFQGMVGVQNPRNEKRYGVIIVRDRRIANHKPTAGLFRRVSGLLGDARRAAQRPGAFHVEHVTKVERLLENLALGWRREARFPFKEDVALGDRNLVGRGLR